MTHFNIKLSKGSLIKLSSILSSMVALFMIIQSLYLPTKAWLSQQLIMSSWEQTKRTKKSSPPWPWADTTAIAKMEVSRLNKSIILLKGTDPTTLAFSAGAMHEFSTLENNRPFVAAGHRDTHFSFLKHIQLKDVIDIEDIYGNYSQYKVESINIIDSNKAPLLLDTNKDKLLLITCYPFNAIRSGGSLRYMIKAKKVTVSHSEIS